MLECNDWRVLRDLPAHSGEGTACCFGFMLTCTQPNILLPSSIFHLSIHGGTILVGEYLSDPDLAEGLDDVCKDAAHTYLLFPTADAVDAATVVESACAHAPAPVQAAGSEKSSADASSCDTCECGCVNGHPFSVLLILDGSWRQAKQLLRKNQVELARATSKTLTLSNHPPSVFGRLKREPDETLLSTAEATAAVVSLLQHGPGQTLHYQPWILPPLELLLEYQFKFITEREQTKKLKGGNAKR